MPQLSLSPDSGVLELALARRRLRQLDVAAAVCDARAVRSRRIVAVTRCASLVAFSAVALWSGSAIGGSPMEAPVERIDVTTVGDQAQSSGSEASVSEDGRFVAFSSIARGLVLADTNKTTDVFVRDRALSITTRVSVATDGSDGDDVSIEPSISADGRYVAFTSYASGLVRKDTNRVADVFVHDRLRHETRRVSVRSDGHQADRYSSGPAISADGRFVAFSSESTNLVSRRRGSDRILGLYRIYIHDRQTGRTTPVSPRPSRGSSDGVYLDASISADGRFVAFTEVRGDRVDWVLVRDRKARRTVRVDVSSRERNANGRSCCAAVSANGRHVAFVSEGANLVPHDDNRGADVFVRDLRLGRTAQASIRPDGTPLPRCPRGWDDERRKVFPCGERPAVSATGRFVAFSTLSTRFDTASGTADSSGIYVRDMRLETTTPVMTGRSDDAESYGRWSEPGISADGRFVAVQGQGVYVRGPLR
jgi:Tol biopolymer transport system component